MTAADFAELAAWRYAPPHDFYDGDQEEPPDPNVLAYAEKLGITDGKLTRDQFNTYMQQRQAERGITAAPSGSAAPGGQPGNGSLNHVAAFNERAIKVYERAGFREVGRHMRTFQRWGEVEFVTMDEQP